MDERSRIRERTGTQDAARADTRAADAAGVCPHCGAPLERDDYEFCPVCGGKLVDYCTFCGAPMSPSDVD